MSTEQLHEFFRQKGVKSSSGQGIDWEARKREFIDSVEELYRTVEEYLADSIRDNLVKVSFSSKQITEDYMGTYEIREMILDVGDERAILSPKGRNIVGGIGRVDLVGPIAEKTLVAQPGGRWSIVVSRTPSLKIVPLDPSSLLTALQEVMGP